MYWVRILGRSRRRTEPPFLPAPSVSSFEDSRAQCNCQSRFGGTGNVDGGRYATDAEQKGDANRELWVWVRICIRNGPRTIPLRHRNILTAGCGFAEVVLALQKRPRAV